MPYCSATDEELVQLWRNGCDEAEVELIRRFPKSAPMRPGSVFLAWNGTTWCKKG